MYIQERCGRKSTTITTRSSMRISPMNNNINKECECKQTQGRPFIFLAENQYKKQQEHRCIESIDFSTFYTTVPDE